MRHKKNRIRELSTGDKEYTTVVRNLMTSLITHGEIVTTSKRARVLKSATDKFFHKLVGCRSRQESDQAAKREAIKLAKSILYTDEAGKKAVNDLASKYRQNDQTNGFVINLKLGPRAGDAAEEVLVKLS